MIYQIILVRDRYMGSYSDAVWTAWENEVPDAVDDSDVPCMLFWEGFTGRVGKGDTPADALTSLLTQGTDLRASWERKEGA